MMNRASGFKEANENFAKKTCILSFGQQGPLKLVAKLIYMHRYKLVTIFWLV